jgi:dTDP-glucose pyrophosphorylase
MARPKLISRIDPEVFDSFYWYKDELQQFAKELGVSTSGGKFEIHDRISHYLRTGEKLKQKTVKPTSDFDWNKEILSPQTLITDNYKNNQNVRAFFEEHIGKGFSFNIDFMNYMKDSVGLTL